MKKKDEVENGKEGNKKIFLKLKKIGKKKVKLYKKPSVKAKVLAKLRDSNKIIYKNQCKKQVELIDLRFGFLKRR